MRFWLGTHETSWLGKTDVPLFISHRRLAPRRRLPVALAAWALDSGGFTELSMHGEWRTTVSAYVEAVHRYRDEIGQLAWAAPMDWMCEPWIVEKTGLSVREHQERTVANYLELQAEAPDLPFIPVLQGWYPGDYYECLWLYEAAGIDLSEFPVVGVGSVCRRQSEREANEIFATFARMGLRLHGFGVKKDGVARYREHLTSADSMAWSYRARRDWPLPGCTHKSCANCIRYALRWRGQLLAQSDQGRLFQGAA